MGESKVKKEEKVKGKDEKSEVVEEVEILSGIDGKSTSLWWGAFWAIMIIAFITRFYEVMEPVWVCWDETHFGKMGSWYINRTFFFDVHPPLGKMMIGAMGYLTGYNGTHPWNKPGELFDDHPVWGMRGGCTLLGTFIVPFAFIAVWDLTRSLSASILAASLLLFDIGMLVLNRYILLDPILLFFIAASVAAMCRFRTLENEPFSTRWWIWLSMTGAMLAGSISVKFVGLFVVLLVGIFTIGQLWDILGDMNKPLSYSCKHFMARALCLILLPMVIYISLFYVHLSVLNKTGNGDGFFSSLFQTTLEGNKLQNATVAGEVSYGARITLKNHKTAGAYLHSHHALYEEGFGAKQQQVTTYAHKDINNDFIMKRWNKEPLNITDPDVDLDIDYVRNGDLVRLEHVITRRNIHSHNQPAPVMKRLYQVSGYGENGTGDANDVFRLEVIDGKEGEIVKAVVHKIKLHHYFMKCVLTTTGKNLPKWGFEQGEVACNPTLRDPNSLWNVEDNYFPKIENITLADMAPGFVSKFIESHKVMLQGNAGLKPKEGEWTSKPWEWPVNYKGQWFSAIEEHRVYLLGNPIIWWGNIVLMAAFVLTLMLYYFRSQRGYVEPVNKVAMRETTISATSWMFLGWALHYFPFYTMGRVLYFHHYFPAHFFACCLSGIIADYLIAEACSLVTSRGVKNVVFHTLFGLVLAASAYGFYLFAPLAYGMEAKQGMGRETNSTYHRIHWLESWEF